MFLAAVALVCRLLTRRGGSARAVTVSLTLFSLFFYCHGCESPWALLPAGGAMLVTWRAAEYMQSGKNGRRLVFALAVSWHVAVLLVYKYTAFFTGGRLSAPGARWASASLPSSSCGC